jgi:ankyrin repeat protein
MMFRCSKDNCTVRNRLRYTPLIYAAESGHVAMVRVLLEGGANLESTDAFRSSALHHAVLEGHLDVCRLLLDWGANVDPMDEWNETPLHDAVKLGHYRVAKLLVERGADVRLKNDDGLTASDVARIKGYKEMAQWLDSESRR